MTEIARLHVFLESEIDKVQIKSIVSRRYPVELKRPNCFLSKCFAADLENPVGKRPSRHIGDVKGV